jgi:hypothetical protein
MPFRRPLSGIPGEIGTELSLTQCDPHLLPSSPTHLQVFRWGKHDSGHIQSHIPLPQNHSCVTAQVWC